MFYKKIKGMLSEDLESREFTNLILGLSNGSVKVFESVGRVIRSKWRVYAFIWG